MVLPKQGRTKADEMESDSGDGALVDLDPLFVPAIIDQSDPDGLLPTGIQTSDLSVWIENRWKEYAHENEQDIVRLYWGRSAKVLDPVQTVPLEGPILEEWFPYELKVPKNYLQSDGRYEVWYTVEITSGSPAPSIKKVVTIDTQPPSYDKQPEALLYPTDLAGPVITEEYLLSHGGKVELSLPLPMYTGAADGDVLSLWWTETDPPTGSWVKQKTIIEAEIVANDVKVDLTEDIIRAPNKNGVFHAFYKLKDRAGNETLVFSKPATATVSLIPIPIDRPPPRVPLHEDDNLLNRADARAQVKAIVDGIDNLDPNDQIRLDWDGSQLAPVPAVLPATINVPWNTLTAKGMGPRLAKVSYDIIRPGMDIPSEVADINVNFTVAGQDHPGAPALVNPLLDFIEIYGNSGVPNVLTAADRPYPVIPRLKLYEAPQPGELLELYWGSVSGPVAEYRVKAGDIEGMTVDFSDVPWSVIDLEPNNTRLPVYYTTSNGVNEQQSRMTEVSVVVEPILGLPWPTFPGINDEGYLNCCSRPRLWEGVRVAVAGNVNFSAGDTVVVTWQGSKGLNGTQPIEGVRDTFPKLLSEADARDGFEVLVLPYDRLIEPMVDNDSAVAFYELIKANGGRGTSRADFVKITRTMPSGNICSPTNDICPEQPDE